MTDALAARIEALERRVRELEDERDIRRTFHRYNRAVDYNGGVDEFSMAFSEDVTSKVTDSNGATLHEEHGVAEVASYQAGSAARRPRPAKHLALASMIEVKEDVAEVENYFVAIADLGEGPFVHVYGLAQNVLVRGADGWRIKDRRATTESSLRR